MEESNEMKEVNERRALVEKCLRKIGDSFLGGDNAVVKILNSIDGKESKNGFLDFSASLLKAAIKGEYDPQLLAAGIDGKKHGKIDVEKALKMIISTQCRVSNTQDSANEIYQKSCERFVRNAGKQSQSTTLPPQSGAPIVTHDESYTRGTEVEIQPPRAPHRGVGQNRN